MPYDGERSKLLRRADRVASWTLDGAIALITLLPTAAIFGHGERVAGRVRIIEVLGGALLSVVPLLVRRRWPVHVLGVILIIGVLVPGPAFFSPPALVALYTVASRRPWRIAAAGTAATAFVFALHRVVWGYPLPLLNVISDLALPALALALGLYQATRLAYSGELHERELRLEREHELLAEQAATDERLRIARELHDVVAHNVTLMVVQAQALGATTGDEDAQAGARSIAELGREAMSEMHRTLELMRPEDGNGEWRPQPTLADLEALLEQTRAAGTDASLRVRGEPHPLAPGVELSAYRIVQEALTNVVKHAGAAHAQVSVNYGSGALELEVVDDGRGGGEEMPSSGHGLVGMRERVGLYGGRLDAGAVNGGYRVHAVLPYSD